MPVRFHSAGLNGKVQRTTSLFAMQAMVRGKKPTRHFPVIVELDEDGVYIVTCPMFKGCHSYGKTVEGGARQHPGSHRALHRGEP